MGKRYLYVGQLIHPSGKRVVLQDENGEISQVEEKVGITDNLKERIKGLSRTITPLEVEFLIAWDFENSQYDANTWEDDIEDFLESDNTYGEWYKTNNLINKISRVMERHNVPLAEIPRSTNSKINDARNDVKKEVKYEMAHSPLRKKVLTLLNGVTVGYDWNNERNKKCTITFKPEGYYVNENNKIYEKSLNNTVGSYYAEAGINQSALNVWIEFRDANGKTTDQLLKETQGEKI